MTLRAGIKPAADAETVLERDDTGAVNLTGHGDEHVGSGGPDPIARLQRQVAEPFALYHDVVVAGCVGDVPLLPGERVQDLPSDGWLLRTAGVGDCPGRAQAGAVGDGSVSSMRLRKVTAAAS